MKGELEGYEKRGGGGKEREGGEEEREKEVRRGVEEE